MALPPKKVMKKDPPDPNPKKSDPDYAQDVAENKAAALKKKKQTSGTVDNLNTSTKSKGPVQANAVTTNQVHGAINAFVAKKKQMSKRTQKRVATKLKAMKASGK